MQKPSRLERLAVPLGLMAAILVMGTVGYRLIEHWGWLDSLFMTIITLTTVGFEEVHPLGPAGQVLTIALIFSGIAVFMYLATVVGPAIIEDVLGHQFRRARVKRQIDQLSEHFILCGCGRVGRLVRREFEGAGVPFVVIERDEAVARDLAEAKVLVLQADATLEASLVDAGIARARGLVTVLSGDADNLYVVITARDLNPRLTIVARAESDTVEKRLIKAGANRVISPNVIGGRIMAQALLQPEVLDFLTLATAREHLTLQIEQIVVRPGSTLAGEQLRIAQMRERHGVFVVAMRKEADPQFDMPTSDRSVGPGDTLIVVGQAGDCAALNRRAATG